MKRYPMKLIPVPRQMIWGGDRLKTKYRKTAPFENVGESWELTIRPEAQSVIENGEYAGQRLCDVIGCGYDFPLLIKFIDARDDLSVQVHPDDNVFDDQGRPLGKTEMWYIIDADEGSYIIYGLDDNMTLEDYKDCVHRRDFSSGMKKVYVKPGESYFIPAGQVHAIGKGILLAEIQQNSDTTYRLYDYDRLDKNGCRRELHIEKALKVIKNHTADDIENLRYTGPYNTNCLADCDKFSCYKYKITEGNPIQFKRDNAFSALIFIGGNACIVCNGIEYQAKPGDTYFVPDSINFTTVGNATFLLAKAKG